MYKIFLLRGDVAAVNAIAADGLTWRLMQEPQNRVSEIVDQRAAAIVSGYTEVLTELFRLLVEKGVLSQDEVRDTITQVVVRGIEQGAQPGFDEVPMILLRNVDGWKPASH